jgi:hypothetical protein
MDVELDMKEREKHAKRVAELASVRAQLTKCSKMMVSASFRKERCELLMRRKSASLWDVKKKARMVRLLMKASQELKESQETLLVCQDRLNEIASPGT